jgi:hypothetical protein
MQSQIELSSLLTCSERLNATFLAEISISKSKLAIEFSVMQEVDSVREVLISYIYPLNFLITFPACFLRCLFVLYFSWRILYHCAIVKIQYMSFIWSLVPL